VIDEELLLIKKANRSLLLKVARQESESHKYKKLYEEEIKRNGGEQEQI